MTLLIDNQRNLHCWAWNRIYIKSNGRIPCWCDSGEYHTLVYQNLIDSDFVNDIVNSPEMRKMRLTILESNTNYIKECDKCSCMMKSGDRKYKRYIDSEIINSVQTISDAAYESMRKTSKIRKWPIGSIDKISEIQLEPSFPCNLRCPGCIHGIIKNPLEVEKPPYLFPLEWFISIIDNCVSHDVKIKRIQYCGKGEPTLNKSLPEMIKYAANFDITQSMDTNANGDFNASYLLLNKLNCSIDGSTSDSYKTYRRNGDFEDAIDFMKSAVVEKRRSNAQCTIRWKYILFDTTEDIHLLNLAQHIANDIGIDELDFVITACGAADNSVRPPQQMNQIDKVMRYISENKIFHKTLVSRS